MDKQVIVYTQPNCFYCKKLKEFLGQKGIQYSEKDVAQDQQAYEEMIQNTATKHAPWYVIPADNKWFTRLAVAGAIIHRLHSLDLQFPEVDDDKKKELAQVRKALLAGKE